MTETAHTPQPEPQQAQPSKTVLGFYERVSWLVLQLTVIVVGGWYLYDLSTLRTPPATEFSPQSFGAWVNLDDREFYFLDMDGIATERKGEFVWTHDYMVDRFFHPVGTWRFREGAFAFDANLPMLATHSHKGQYSSDNPRLVYMDIDESASGARKLWLYGCVAAWAGPELTKPSVMITLTFEDGGPEVLPFASRDVGLAPANWDWPGTDPILAYVGPKVMFYECSYTLPTSRGRLTRITFEDTGTPASDLFLALTLER